MFGRIITITARPGIMTTAKVRKMIPKISDITSVNGSGIIFVSSKVNYGLLKYKNPEIPN